MWAKDLNFKRDVDQLDFGWLKMSICQLTISHPTMLDIALLHGLLEKAGGRVDWYFSRIRTEHDMQDVVEGIWTFFSRLA